MTTTDVGAVYIQESPAYSMTERKAPKALKKLATTK